MKRPRRSKNETLGRKHTCNICKKSYFSYPALYTHKRNKHNIIPITGKQEVFKSKISNNMKFKYSAFDYNSNIKGITTDLMLAYSDICKKHYNNTNSIFYCKNFILSNDSFYKLLSIYNTGNITQIKIPKERELKFIDNILIIYLILLLEVTKDQYYLKLLVKFIFSLRNFLNTVGWDHNRFLSNYGLIDIYSHDGEFCLKNTCEQIPELINNYITVLLTMESEFLDHLDELIDISQNFCNWLYINDYTNFKIFKGSKI